MDFCPEENKDAFICEFCSKSFPEETLLFVHLYICTKEQTDAGESSLKCSLALSHHKSYFVNSCNEK